MSPGRPDSKSRRDGEGKENETESVSERCLLSSRGREDIQYGKHSGRSIWQWDCKTVERHQVAAGEITHSIQRVQFGHTHSCKQIHKASSTHSLSLCRLTSTPRHKQDWTSWGKNKNGFVSTDIMRRNCAFMCMSMQIHMWSCNKCAEASVSATDKFLYGV